LHDLGELISHDCVTITPLLLQRGLISKSTESRTRLNNTGLVIAGEILDNILSFIKVQPELYPKFLESLQKGNEVYYKKIIEDLEEERNMDQQRSSSKEGKNVVRFQNISK